MIEREKQREGEGERLKHNLRPGKIKRSKVTFGHVKNIKSVKNAKPQLCIFLENLEIGVSAKFDDRFRLGYDVLKKN